MLCPVPCSPPTEHVLPRKLVTLLLLGVKQLGARASVGPSSKQRPMPTRKPESLIKGRFTKV